MPSTESCIENFRPDQSFFGLAFDGFIITVLDSSDAEIEWIVGKKISERHIEIDDGWCEAIGVFDASFDPGDGTQEGIVKIHMQYGTYFF